MDIKEQNDNFGKSLDALRIEIGGTIMRDGEKYICVVREKEDSFKCALAEGDYYFVCRVNCGGICYPDGKCFIKYGSKEHIKTAVREYELVINCTNELIAKLKSMNLTDEAEKLSSIYKEIEEKRNLIKTELKKQTETHPESENDNES